MKNISLDFTNGIVCIMTDAQQGTEINTGMEKTKLYSFIPEKYRGYNSFTWNFENETFAANQDHILQNGEIMTADCFIPQVIAPMPGLRKHYKEFTAILGYEEVNLKAELPEALRKIFGLD